RNISYKTSGPYESGDFEVSDQFTFFNPKAGITYLLNPNNKLYLSFARAHKEPNRSDYKSAVIGINSPIYPKAESLNDFELGWRLNTAKTKINTNLYYMAYQDQLVLTGEIDPEGRFIRQNSGKS